MLLPMKMAIMKAMDKRDTFVIKDIMDELEPVYGSERQFRFDEFDHAFRAMKAEGLIERVELIELDNGDIGEIYRMTEHGKNRIKIIPER